MELSQIVKEVMMVLTPALPMLAAGGTEAAKEVGKSAGKTLPAVAKKIWEVLNYEIELKPPGLQEAITDVKKAPKDTDALQLLELQLKKMLNNDETLAQQLLDALQHDRGTSAGKFHVQAEHIQGMVQGDHAEVTMNFGKE